VALIPLTMKLVLGWLGNNWHKGDFARSVGNVTCDAIASLSRNRQRLLKCEKSDVTEVIVVA